MHTIGFDLHNSQPTPYISPKMFYGLTSHTVQILRLIRPEWFSSMNLGFLVNHFWGINVHLALMRLFCPSQKVSHPNMRLWLYWKKFAVTPNRRVPIRTALNYPSRLSPFILSSFSGFFEYPSGYWSWRLGPLEMCLNDQNISPISSSTHRQCYVKPVADPY